MSWLQRWIRRHRIVRLRAGADYLERTYGHLPLTASVVARERRLADELEATL